MKLLLVGAGGREHAIAWKLAQSPHVTQIFVTPGNAGTSSEMKVSNVALATFDEMIAFCKREGVAYSVVGPEAPLASGIVNAFQEAGLAIFGPTKEAARLESSKNFAKSFMMRHNIPTAAYRTFHDEASALSYVKQQGAPIVIKADGLTQGKGVVVAESVQVATEAVRRIFRGTHGASVVIEQYLAGEEASFIVMSDGVNVVPLASSQDHKRLLDGDKGPNTGGMGAYSPAPVVDETVHEKVMARIIRPTITGMALEGTPFVGFLYAGLMIDEKGDPHTIEFNCRMGDPETQAILCRLESDFSATIKAALQGYLHEVTLDWTPETSCAVVMTSGGYPETSSAGDVIHGLAEASSHAKIFHAGTALNTQGELITNGGRVLCAVGLGSTVQVARDKAYSAVDVIMFNNRQYRHDIGYRALSR